MSEATERILKLPGIKQRDLKPCAFCGKGVGNGNNICCLRVKVTRLMINVGAVQRQTGLEMMLGSPALAAVMGTDEDVLKPLGDEVDALICDNCAMDRRVCQLAELESP
jgi:hypothetical protein